MVANLRPVSLTYWFTPMCTMYDATVVSKHADDKEHSLRITESVEFSVRNTSMTL
jgi:hypothetical protein